MIEIKDVTKRFGTKRALDDVSIALPQGQIVGLFGENGAGKTTLMKCVLGFLSYSGRITLGGEPISRQNIERLSFATNEHSFFPNLDAQSHKEFYGLQFPKFSERRFNGLMEFFALPGKEPIRQFSTGQKNQFEVILSLCQGADYIMMDEPFAGNDVFNREDFYKVLLGILEPNETILLATHLIEEVQNFIGRAILINHGKIVGDVKTLDLEESGESLMDHIKKTYRYRADRVGKALSELTGTKE